MATIKEMLTANTADILEATELLKVLGDRDGQFVWKKFKVETVEVENPTFIISGSAGTGATVASDSVDLSLIDESFFDGFMNDAENRWFFYDENGLHYYNGADNYDAVWDNVSCTMKLLNNTASFSGTTFHYTGTKTVYHRAEEDVTVEYAVADDETSYPNGGLLDGHWYELFKEGIKGIDYGTVKISSSGLTTITVAHNLKVAPAYAVLLHSSPSPTENQTTGSINGYAVYQTGGSDHVDSVGITKEIDSVTFKAKTSQFESSTTTFKTGTYRWFVAEA